MACSGGGACGGGGCGREEDEDPLPSVTALSPHQSGKFRLCIKCKEETARILANQTEPLCPSCLRASLLGRFKFVLNNHAFLGHGAKILVAFSGGAASRLALEFLHEIRSKAQEDASWNSKLPVFQLGVVFVNEGSAFNSSELETQSIIKEISSIVSDAALGDTPFHVTFLEDVFDGHGNLEMAMESSNLNREQLFEVVNENFRACSRIQLRDLLSSVKDKTGLEDVVECLRNEAIQTVAKKYGYSRIVLGLCTTRLSGKIIAATAKGQGYALPAAIQYVDARWKVPIIFPFRDCVHKELSLVCHYTNLKTVFVRNISTYADADSTLNNLAHSFVSLLRQENPARDHTIVKTATKLMPFSFNNLNGNSAVGNRKKHGDTSRVSIECLNQERLCPICSAPLMQVEEGTEHSDHKGIEYESSDFLLFRDQCCPSCRYQIIPDYCSHVFRLLPQFMYQKMSRKEMKSEIEDFLLDESD